MRADGSGIARESSVVVALRPAQGGFGVAQSRFGGGDVLWLWAGLQLGQVGFGGGQRRACRVNLALAHAGQIGRAHV